MNKLFWHNYLRSTRLHIFGPFLFCGSLLLYGVPHCKMLSKNLTASHTKMHVYREMQFVSHWYTVVSCQPILRHSVFKNSAVYLSGASVRFFFERYTLWVPRLLAFQERERSTYSSWERTRYWYAISRILGDLVLMLLSHIKF